MTYLNDEQHLQELQRQSAHLLREQQRQRALAAENVVHLQQLIQETLQAYAATVSQKTEVVARLKESRARE
ncbi:MAG: hypothetical protein JO316_26720 [Abitibacteriaceae bacterium]|nr:hypothetical protein [Abditibacteriaceae bacterium]